MDKNKKILLINAGSSSIKFQLLVLDNFEIIAKGLCEAIGLDIAKFKIKYQNQDVEENATFKDFNEAMNHIFKFFNDHQIITNNEEIVGIGHRVVHDGAKTKGWAVIDDETLKIIEDNIVFAPLHNKYELDAIKITKKMFPSIIQVACFDTGFHHSIDKYHYMYAIKKEWYEKYNIRRFGFHGLSYDYINSKMKTILNKDKNNLIVCHLGSGASMCFIKDSQSFNTSMGFGTYDGLIMCTRTGDISPETLVFLCNKLNLSPNEVSKMFLKECGLKGLTSYSDIRYVENDLNNPDNALAFELFINRIVDYIAMGINQLDNKVDGIVFTAGIGEHSTIVRQAIADKLKVKKLVLDQTKNKVTQFDDYALISTPESEINVYVVNTNEEIVIAKYLKEAIETNK